MRKHKKNGFYYNRIAVFDLNSFQVLVPHIAKRKRWKVYARDNYSCLNCGAAFRYILSWMDAGGGLHYDAVVVKDDAEYMLTMDHHFPKSKGGSNSIENLRSLCEPCNSQKKDVIP